MTTEVFNSDFSMNVENNLNKFFHPVEPDPAFIQSLQVKLSKPRTIRLDRSRISGPMVVLLTIGAGLFAGIMGFWLVRWLKNTR